MNEQDLIPAAEQPATPDTERLKLAIRDLVTNNILLDVDREKTYQYAEARKSELYWRGSQFIYPVLVGGSVADWSVNVGTSGYNSPEDEREGQYDYVLNIIRGDGRKFIAVLGQRGPSAKAQSRRPDDEGAAQRARLADVGAAYLRSTWNPEKVQRHLAMSLWKSGTTFAYTPWVSNSDKYGTVDEPVIEPDPVTGVASMVGVKSYPKGSVELHLATIFEVTVPFYSKSLADAPWLWYEYEEHSGKLLQAYPQLRAKLGSEDWAGGTDDAATSASGQLARDIASSPTGAYISPRKNRWRYSRFWMRPAMLQLVTDDQLRTALLSKFPRGVKVTMVQGEVVDLAHERLDDVWAACKPDTSEYIFADPICKDYMSIQDIVNDLYNMVVETMERSIPYMLADPLVLDVLQLNKQRGKPGQIIPAKAGVGARLGDSIVKAPTAQIDPEVFKWIETIHASGRENAGVMPAIFGGDTPSGTAREAELRRNQALQQLNTVWNEMRDFWQAVYYNAVRQIARHALPDGSNLGEYEAVESDFSSLLEGGWFFTTEEAMPMTWGQKRDLILYMIQNGPQAWQLFGLDHPLNITKVQEIIGMPGWTIPNLMAREKVLTTIKLLLGGQPVDGPQGPQPSIAPDVFEDDHIFTASIVKEWAQGEEARAIREQNPQGYANVIAFGTAHLQLGGPGSQAPPPGGPSGPGGGAPPAPGPAGPGMPITPDVPGQGAQAGMPQAPPPGATIGGPPMAGPQGSLQVPQ